MNTNTLQDTVFRLIMLVALVVFAIYGITQLAPAVGQVLSDRLEKAGKVQPRL